MQDPSEWRLTSPGGIKHKLIRQWGKFGRENASWNMEICIQSHDLTAFIMECFPVPVVMGTLVSYPRRFYPAGLPALECKDVSVEEFTSGRPIDPFAAGLAYYTTDEYNRTFEPYLKLTISFGPSPTNDQERNPTDPFTFLEISASASGEFLSQEVNQDDNVLWEDENGIAESPDEYDTALGQTIMSHEVEWSCKWPQIPFAFFYDTLKPRLHDVMGKVNNAPLSLFGNAPAETILFLNYKIGYEYTWRDGFSGESPIQLTMNFVEKNFKGRQKNITTGLWQNVQVTHNHLYRANHGWQRLLVDTKLIYEEHDMMEIFTG